MPYHINRRQFLKILTGIMSTAALAGCESEETASPTATLTPTPTATPSPVPETEGTLFEIPFGVWSTLRDALRRSPDHLPARARALIADGDPDPIYAFVRDQIRVQPGQFTRFDPNNVMEALWGPRTTLRSGIGSFRDKADLLADMFNQAGHPAEVVEARVDWDAAQVREAILRPVARVFDPRFEDTTPDELLAKMQSDPDPPQPPLSPDAVVEQAHAVADALLTAFPPDDQVYDFAYPALEHLPIVRVEVGSETRFANPFVTDGMLGEHYAVEPPTRRLGSSMLSPASTIDVTLLVAYSSNPGERIPVVRGEWHSHELLGRQLIAQFLPAMRLSDMPGRSAGQVSAFLPSLIVQGADLTPETAQELSVVERMITVGGEIIEIDEVDTVTVNGQPLQTSRSNQAAQATSLEMTLLPGGFPRIVAQVKVLDAAGEPVNGLLAGDFQLVESAILQSLLLRQNQVLPPRVLLLFDTSDSIPESFRAEGIVQTGQTLTDQLLQAYPEAGLSFMAVGDSRPTAWISDPNAVEDAITSLGGYGSDLWSAIQVANKSRPDVILLVTDGQNTETLTPDLRDAAAGGAPVIALGVGETEQTILDQIAAITGGIALSIGAPEEAVQAALDYVQRQQTIPVSLSYTAPFDGEDTRSVVLSLRDDPDVRAEATYTVPRVEDRAAPSIAGMYLEIRHGRERIVRTLAGYDSYQNREPVTQQDMEAALAGLFGSAVLSFEGMPPLIAPLLDDVLTARLTMQPVAEALAENNAPAVYEALNQGVTPILSDALAMQMPLIHELDAASLTFATTPRMVLYHAMPTPRAQVRRVDLLSLSHWGTANDDPREAYRQTAARTAQLAITEAARFDTSALELLAGQTLIEVDPYSTRFGFQDVPDEVLGQWHLLIDPLSRDYRLYAPANGEPVAMWMQHAATGTLIAVLPDGSGGGSSSDTTEPFDRAETLLNLADLGGGILGASMGFGVWIALETTKLKKLRAATLHIAALPVTSTTAPGEGSTLPTEADHAIRDFMAGIYNGLVDSVVGNAFPGYSHLGTLDKIVSMASDGRGYVIPFPFHLPTSDLDD